MELELRKFFVILKLALIGAIAYSAVLVLLWAERKPELLRPQGAEGSQLQPVDSLQTDRDQQIDYSAILTRNLFAATVGSLDPAGAQIQEQAQNSSAAEQLGLELVGTVAGSSAVARAVLRDRTTKTVEAYKLGQTVRGARIEQIAQDHVVLLHNGRRVVLSMTAEKAAVTGKGNRSESASESTGSPVVAGIPAIGKPAEDTPIAARITQIATLLRAAKVEPVITNGQVEGLKVSELGNPDLAASFGLRDGDIIRTINGHRLTSKQKAFQVLMKARSAPRVDVELLRAGKSKTLSFILR